MNVNKFSNRLNAVRDRRGSAQNLSDWLKEGKVEIVVTERDPESGEVRCRITWTPKDARGYRKNIVESWCGDKWVTHEWTTLCA
jgi:hypothetical protein